MIDSIILGVIIDKLITLFFILVIITMITVFISGIIVCFTPLESLKGVKNILLSCCAVLYLITILYVIVAFCFVFLCIFMHWIQYGLD
jgi:hypothetical protein